MEDGWKIEVGCFLFVIVVFAIGLGIGMTILIRG